MHLTQDQLAELRDLLQEERTKFVRQVKGVLGHGVEAHGDSADCAWTQSDAEMLFGLEEHERERVLEIEEALGRIEAGTYGVCETCGESIPFARLRAIPTARHTTDCQEKIDLAQR